MFFGGIFLASILQALILEDGKTPKAYDIVWNAPTIRCLPRFGVKIDPTAYGIRQNVKNGLIGQSIALLYQEDLGLYPYFDTNGSAVNGGLPQLVNMTSHLAKLEQDISRLVPDRGFSGLGIMDWESWRPVWARNYDHLKIYQDKSIELVQHQHPTWSKAKILSVAKQQFEDGARNLMETTLNACKALRPGGKWGFYLFPECHNYHGNKSCSSETKKQNDQLSWLFNASTGLYPSVYLPSQLDEPHRFTFVFGEVTEAARVRKVVGKTNSLPIYVYTKFSKNAQAFYSIDELTASVFAPSVLGVEGITVWGSYLEGHSQQNCLNVQRYLTTTYGQFAQKTLQWDSQCSASLCHSHGRCVVNETTLYTYIHFTGNDKQGPDLTNLQTRAAIDRYLNITINAVLNKNDCYFNTRQTRFECQCFLGWTGSHCNTPTTAAQSKTVQ